MGFLVVKPIGSLCMLRVSASFKLILSAKAFAKDLDREVYCLDARNHGESPHDPTHNYSVMAEDVREFIQEHQLKEPIVIGNPMILRYMLT
jgi:pimeloyl-ACP methyl ester carboxylesterase